jgi:hypothetical protein
MSKIVVDQIHKTGGTALTLPAADGTAGQQLSTDGSGNLSFSGGASSASKIHTFTKSFGGNTGSGSSQKVMWTDIKSDVVMADIVNIRMTGHMVCSSNFTVYAMGLNSSGSPLTNGYLGYGQKEFYNGSSVTDSTSHNSNNGHIWFPGYTTIYSEGQSYGDGIQFTYDLTPKKFGSYGGHFHRISHIYQQDTSYDYPNGGQMMWNNYGANTPPDTWEGIIFYPSAGTFESDDTKCRVTFELMVE